MLTGQEIQMLIVSGAVGAVVISIPLTNYLNKKNINTEKIITEVKEAIAATEPAIAVAKEVVPNNTIVNAIDIIEKWAVKGADKAEQLYHANQLISNSDRFSAAKETVYSALKEFNITPTENQEKLINDTIEAAVNNLGHKDKTETEKEAEKQALVNQNQQLQSQVQQSQNTVNQLQQKIVNIQSVAAQ